MAVPARGGGGGRGFVDLDQRVSVRRFELSSTNIPKDKRPLTYY